MKPTKELVVKWDREALAKKLAQHRGGHSGFPPASWDYDLADAIIQAKNICSIEICPA